SLFLITCFSFDAKTRFFLSLPQNLVGKQLCLSFHFEPGLLFGLKPILIVLQLRLNFRAPAGLFISSQPYIFGNSPSLFCQPTCFFLRFSMRCLFSLKSCFFIFQLRFNFGAAASLCFSL